MGFIYDAKLNLQHRPFFKMVHHATWANFYLFRRASVFCNLVISSEPGGFKENKRDIVPLNILGKRYKKKTNFFFKYNYDTFQIWNVWPFQRRIFFMIISDYMKEEKNITLVVQL